MLLFALSLNPHDFVPCHVMNQGCRVPFLSVAHDGWDGKRRLMFGVSTMFVNPVDMVMCRIPIALSEPVRKDADVLTDSTMTSLKRVRAEENDVFRAVNDNCTAAIWSGCK